MDLPENIHEMVDFSDLETRVGHDSALEILRALERFEGIRDTDTHALSAQERLENVFRQMQENMKYQTRH